MYFWFEEIDSALWFKKDNQFDETIRTKFLATYYAATRCELSNWRKTAEGRLAEIVVLDQFSRNMFRGTSQAFEMDRAALAAAKQAISKGWDMRIDEPARQFFYMPLMHSECLVDQDRSVRLFVTRMPETGHKNLLHAKAHREVIRLFGRFPYRNDALDRETPATEAAYLADGGYGATVRALSA